MMDALKVTRGNIWQYAQNKPSLVADDLEQFGVPRNITMKVLLARGVFKWLSIRRKVIKLKNIWKAEITEAIENIRTAKRERNFADRYYWKGYLKAKEECRNELRGYCHGERWDAPDFCKESQRIIKEAL